MKRGTCDHPKFLRLCVLLNLRKYEAMGLLEALWHFTARFAPQGNIGKFTDLEIAKAVEWERPTGARGVTPECKLSGALVEAGWLDRDAEHRLLVHDWFDHADQTVKRFLASRGLAFIQHRASPPVPLPVPEPVPEPEPTNPCAADAAPEPEPPAGLFVLDPPKPEHGKAWFDEQHERFYRSYWRRVGPKDSRKAFESRVKALVAKGLSHEDAVEFLVTAASDDQKRFIGTPDWEWRQNLHPSTWLNGERWRDEPRSRASPDGQGLTLAERAKAIGRQREEARRNALNTR